jgi:Rubrerythrin
MRETITGLLEKLYKKAKELAEQKKDIDEKRFSICPICGHTVVGEPPERCPICGASNDKFLIFE